MNCEWHGSYSFANYCEFNPAIKLLRIQSSNKLNCVLNTIPRCKRFHAAMRFPAAANVALFGELGALIDETKTKPRIDGKGQRHACGGNAKKTSDTRRWWVTHRTLHTIFAGSDDGAEHYAASLR